jgi:hypothetical protein
MLRLPVCGSAKLVEDTVAHAINLQNREDYNEKRTLGLRTHKPRRRSMNDAR